MFSYDLHLHTRFSYDSKTDPIRLLERARAAGCKGVAITDHETAEGALYARRMNPFNDLEIIVGQEVKTEVGDVIGLFIESTLREHTFRELCQEIHGQSGLIVLPHPFKKKSEIDPEVIRAVDCIEIFNARIKEEENRKALELCEATGKPFTAGSDAHTLGEVGRGYLETADPGLTSAAVLTKNQFFGSHSPRYVHYISAVIGNRSKGTLAQAIARRGLPHGLRTRLGW